MFAFDFTVGAGFRNGERSQITIPKALATRHLSMVSQGESVAVKVDCRACGRVFDGKIYSSVSDAHGRNPRQYWQLYLEGHTGQSHATGTVLQVQVDLQHGRVNLG
jgi:hypothetical protein